MSMVYSGNSITFPDGTVQNTVSLPGMRNRIINGAMMLNQRGASVTSPGGWPVDRWQWDNNDGTSATLTMAQSTVAPAGFTNSLSVTVGTADTSIGANDLIDFRHWIEGYNVADFGLGTASASTFTVSFWVRSSVTGTYGVSFRNSGANRVYVSTFTISAANTWEQKSVTVPGDTTGTWLTDNGRGLGMAICLVGGSTYQTTAGSWSATANYRTTSAQVNFVGTSGATFYITGVQLEKGSTATSFDYRPYGTELQLCQRYYYKTFPKDITKVLGFGAAYATTAAMAYGTFPVSMRTAPSALEQSGTASHYQFIIVGTTTQALTSVPGYNSSTSADRWAVSGVVASGLTQNVPVRFSTSDSTGANAYLAWSAEL